jgi:hypothetical protein
VDGGVDGRVARVVARRFAHGLDAMPDGGACSRLFFGFVERNERVTFG